MTTDLASKGPERSEAQRIGNDAEATLSANKPEKWHLAKEGGDDFGYDYSVIAFAEDENKGAQYAFKVQLKGTTQERARVEDGKYLSHSFSRKTLNLWHNSSFAVLIAIADLIDTRDPKAAKIYFKLVNEDLDELLPELPDAQESLTLRVPIVNEIHRHLDIIPTVRAYLDSMKEARLFIRRRRQASGGLVDEAVGLETLKNEGNIGLEGALGGDEIEFLIKNFPRCADLMAALGEIRVGNYERTLAICHQPTREEIEAFPEQAGITLYLRYRALTALGEISFAEEEIALSAALLPNVDEVMGALYQKELNKIEFGEAGAAARAALLASIPDGYGVGVAAIKSKLLAVEGEFDAARKIIEPFPEDKTVLTKVILSLIERNWGRAISEAEEGRKIASIPDRQKLWFTVFEARAHFQIAIENVRKPDGEDFIIPSTGLPGMDIDEIRIAFDLSREALIGAQRLNWPVDAHLVLDVVSISAMFLGEEEEVLPLLIAFALARPKISQIREVVARICIQCGRPEATLQLEELSKGAEKFEGEDLVMAVAAYKAGNIKKALGYINEELLADELSSEFYLSSLLMLGVAAASSLKFDLLEKIRRRLAKDEFSLSYLAVLESAIAVKELFLARSAVIKRLYKYWSECGRPAHVGYHLIVNADESNADEAAIIVDVSSILEVENSLSSEHHANVLKALITLGRIDDAAARLDKVCKQFPNDAQLLSLRGIVLELSGRSAEAFELIGGLLEAENASDTARRYYVDIAARFGFFDKAEDQVRSAYVKAKTNDQKLRCLNTIFQLILASGGGQSALEEIAWQYGMLANRYDEREEGFFLQQYMIATMQGDEVRHKERIEQVRQRLDDYIKRFPKSKYFYSVGIPKDGPPDAILAALQEAAGVSNEAIVKANAVERKMDQGALRVPFSWRPRRFLMNVSDIFMLWHIGMRAPQEKMSLHFDSSVDNYIRPKPADLESSEVVLSLTSLLVLNEIGLLKLVLETFSKIVIARATLITLQEGRGFLSSGWSGNRALEILKLLQANFAGIQHPAMLAVQPKNGIPEWHEEEKSAMQSPNAIYFCDDVIETILVCGAGGDRPVLPSISSAEFMEWADKNKGIIKPEEVSEKLGNLIQLKINSIGIDRRYLFAAIPKTLQNAATDADGEAAFRSANALRAILDGLWMPFRPFKILLIHFGETFEYLLVSGGAGDCVLVEVWLRWLQAVRFQTSEKTTPYFKVALAFLKILSLLPDDGGLVGRLWRAYWEVLRRGFPELLREPEDKAGVRQIGSMLGLHGAEKMLKLDTGISGVLLSRAKLGLVDGTELYSILDDSYVSAAAEKTQRLMMDEARNRRE